LELNRTKKLLGAIFLGIHVPILPRSI